MPILRQQVDASKVDEALDHFVSHLKRTLLQKGNGAFVSRHEALGVITEEYTELVEAIKDDQPLGAVGLELLDIAVGCVFALACIEAGAFKERS